MNILAIETSGRVMTVALRSNESFCEFVVNQGFAHGGALMPAVARVLEQTRIDPSDINLVSCSRGPGSFTGLRIGMATAKGLARGANCPLKTVATLPLLAAGREHWPGIVVPLMNARKNRVYTAAFRAGERIQADVDIALDDFMKILPKDESILVTGSDAGMAESYHRIVVDPLHAAGRGMAMIHMAQSLFMSEGGDPSDIGPLYLRLSEAEIGMATKRIGK